MHDRSTLGRIDTPDLQNRDSYTISDLSDEFGVTARALRFYEDEGLIAPERRGLTRVYSKRDRARSPGSCAPRMWVSAWAKSAR